MSSNFQQPTPEELEVQITALLLGELSGAEAETLRGRIASNTQLQRLHDDLKKTIELVQQTTTSRESFTVTIARPPTLSAIRREKLLASFKTHELQKVSSNRTRRDLLALAAMVLGLVAVTAVMFRSEIFGRRDRQTFLASSLGDSKAETTAAQSQDTFRFALSATKPAEPQTQSDSGVMTSVTLGGTAFSLAEPASTTPYDPDPQRLTLAQKEGGSTASAGLPAVSNPTPSPAGGYGYGGAARESRRIVLPGSSPASSTGGEAQSRGDFDFLSRGTSAQEYAFVRPEDTLSQGGEGFWGNNPSSDSKDEKALRPGLIAKNRFDSDFDDGITVLAGESSPSAQTGKPKNGGASVTDSWGGTPLAGTGYTASLWARAEGKPQNGALGLNFSVQDQPNVASGIKGVNGPGEKDSGMGIEAGRRLSSNSEKIPQDAQEQTKTYVAGKDKQIAQRTDGSLKSDVQDLSGPAALGDRDLWQLIQTPQNHVSTFGRESSNKQLALNNVNPQGTNAAVDFGSVLSTESFYFNGTTMPFPAIEQNAFRSPKPIESDGEKKSDSFGVSGGLALNSLGFHVSGNEGAQDREWIPTEGAARLGGGSGKEIDGLKTKIDDLADLEKGKRVASPDPKPSKLLEDRSVANQKLSNLTQRSAESEESSKLGTTGNRIDPLKSNTELSALALPTLPGGDNREKIPPVAAAPIPVQQLTHQIELGDQTAEVRYGIDASKPGTPENADLRRKLEKAQETQEQLQLRIAQEELEAKVSKDSIVEVIDQAEAHPSEQPGFWKRLRTGLTGNVERSVHVKVEKDTGDVGGLEGKLAGGSFDPYWVETEFETIQSKAVLSRVIDKLNLNTVWAEKQGGGKPLTSEEAYRHLKENVTVQQDRNSSLVNIRVKSDKPEEAARIANTIAETYRDLRQKQRLEVSRAGVKLLQKQLGEQEKAITELSHELGVKRQENQREVVQRPKPSPNAPVPQPESQSADNPFSTFSLNVSDVSYKLASASLEKGVMPDPASIRSEEFINAFDYRDPEAPSGVPIAFNWDRAAYPFAQNRDILRFSLKTAARGREPGKPLNLVLLLDNSGSMERADRVRIIHECLRVLGGKLQPQDRVSAVSFSRRARLWLDGIPGNQATDLPQRVGSLTPEGGTNLEEAMNVAYQAALKHYLTNGANRIVLLTDGAANLGNVDPELLKKTVENYRKQGIALDCFGIGWEGYNDDLLEVLSRNGDGRYGFVNTPEAATTEFASQLAGALQVAASDVKVQVEFNPRRITSYRQIGYAKHQLTKEQFRDNTVDAAELGAAEAGNALYVVEVNPAGEGPLATVRVRYKIPGTAEYQEKEWPVAYNGVAKPLDQATPALRLASAASAFSEWLAATPYASEVTPSTLLSYFPGIIETFNADPRPKKLEWMIREASRLSGSTR